MDGLHGYVNGLKWISFEFTIEKFTEPEEPKHLCMRDKQKEF
jgi:hypothetical protein